MANYGASHSGEGGGSSSTHGAAYDNFIQPSLPGSGGDNTYGGGVIKLEVSGTADIQGEIKAEYGTPYAHLEFMKISLILIKMTSFKSVLPDFNYLK